MSAESRGASVQRVSAVLAMLLQGGKPVHAADPATGELAQISLQFAAAPHGFLPLFLAAGDTVWREATGRRLGIELRRDPDTVLGFRAHGIIPGPAAPVLLSMMEAIAEAERPDMLLVNDLKSGWAAAQERMRRSAPKPTAALAAPGASDAAPSTCSDAPIPSPRPRRGGPRP